MDKTKDKSYDFIRFVAMVFIIVHHFFTTYNDYVSTNWGWFEDLFYSLGRIGVAMFFMLSGSLLIRNYKNKFEVGKFYKKRFLRIYVPHFISYLMFIVVYLILFPERLVGVKFSSFITGFFALDFFATPLSSVGVNLLWLVGEWFTTIILIIYLIFPLLRWLFKKYKTVSTIFIFAIFILNLKFQFLTYGEGWFSLTNGIMCFWTGMLLEENKKYYKGIAYLATLFTLLLFIVVQPDALFGNKYLPIFILSILLFIIFTNFHISCKISEYVCKYNFELYLVHHRVFYIFIPIFLPYMVNIPQIIFFAIIMILITCVCSHIVKYLTNKTLGFSDKIYIKLKERKR